MYVWKLEAALLLQQKRTPKRTLGRPNYELAARVEWRPRFHTNFKLFAPVTAPLSPPTCHTHVAHAHPSCTTAPTYPAAHNFSPHATSTPCPPRPPRPPLFPSIFPSFYPTASLPPSPTVDLLTTYLHAPTYLSPSLFRAQPQSSSHFPCPRNSHSPRRTPCFLRPLLIVSFYFRQTNTNSRRSRVHCTLPNHQTQRLFPLACTFPFHIVLVPRRCPNLTHALTVRTLLHHLRVLPPVVAPVHAFHTPSSSAPPLANPPTASIPLISIPHSSIHHISSPIYISLLALAKWSTHFFHIVSP